MMRSAAPCAFSAAATSSPSASGASGCEQAAVAVQTAIRVGLAEGARSRSGRSANLVGAGANRQLAQRCHRAARLAVRSAVQVMWR